MDQIKTMLSGDNSKIIIASTAIITLILVSEIIEQGYEINLSTKEGTFSITKGK